jgi:very-short-patch-repair endonuclease
MDFLLPDYRVDLEVRGPFHDTSSGLARDVLRNSVIEASGFKVVQIDNKDFYRLKPRILEIIGTPV